MDIKKTIIIVLRTSIKNEKDIKKVSEYLNIHEAIFSWNFDLEDRENILKLKATKEIQLEDLIERMKLLGYDCEELL
ncbi:hypothetical protein [Sediminibacter sp. Hel_I_10]|uniref:hypothetical protein n=1 Tax=Sediminibacter sp. Hel_I_10 TaxID=1392490 RepID=UPI0004798F09|nr:hypothetical protein [Sediminibacter sp. Hel_I_10]